MLNNAFAGKSEQPKPEEVAEALGEVLPVWNQLIADLEANGIVDHEEWGTYSPKAGWSLRALKKERRIAYLVPSRGSFRVMLVLGDKAVVAARELGLSERMLKALDSAPRYPEGTALRLPVTKSDDLEEIVKLAAVKSRN